MRPATRQPRVNLLEEQKVDHLSHGGKLVSDVLGDDRERQTRNDGDEERGGTVKGQQLRF
jgi:hypothetical protein